VTNTRQLVGLIWAEDLEGVIGAGGVMPWHLPEDLEHFKAITIGGTVIMGRKTWDSLPYRNRPLPGRRNIVITRQSDWRDAGAEVAASVDEALALAREGNEDAVWVIGGGQIFAALIDTADVIEVTHLAAGHPGDTYAPDIPEQYSIVARSPDTGWHTARNGTEYRFMTLRAVRAA
jgi:dihydrofolate reductase